MSERKSFDDRAFDVCQYMRHEAQTFGHYIDQVSITRGDFARRFGVSRTHAGRLLERMCREGLLVRDVNKRATSSPLGVVEYWLSEQACDTMFQQLEISWKDNRNG